ncbi:MAG: hypothetical protein ACK4VK_06170 [Aquificaceae bacterium]
MKEVSHPAYLPSNTLYKCLKELLDKGYKKAREVFPFYLDLYKSIRLISKKVKPFGYVCFIVGSRKVKGLELPTDIITVDFFQSEGFEHVKTIVREISNKRMPLLSSPSNIKGNVDFTMRYEYIVILKKL